MEMSGQQKLSEMKCMLPEMKCNGKDKVQKSPNSVLNVQNKQKSISRKLKRSEADPDISIKGFQNNLF
jgi:hypothetical protein